MGPIWKHIVKPTYTGPSGPGPEKFTPVPVPTDTDLIVAITGHRPDKLGGWGSFNPIKTNVMNELRKAFDQLKPKAVITGMALGVDQWAAEICIEKDIPFFAAIPHEQQDKPWKDSAKIKYHALLEKAYAKATITPGPYASGTMQIRNKWMVDNCQILLAVYDGTPGGTGNCIRYAQQVGKPIIFLPINTIPEKDPLSLEGIKKPSEVLSDVQTVNPKVHQQYLTAQIAMAIFQDEMVKELLESNLIVPGEIQYKPLPKEKEKVIVSGNTGKISSAEKPKELVPFERLVDLD